MIAAAIQFKATKGDWNQSLHRISPYIEAAAGPCDLVVLPEMALTGYLFDSVEAAMQVAEAPDGPTYQALAPYAKKGNCYLVAGFPEKDGDDVFNSALVIDPRGKLEFVYRKTLLYEADFPWATPGDSGYPLIKTEHGEFAVGICMDLNDDAFIEWLERNQPRAVAFPTNWLDQDYNIWGYWAWRLGNLQCALVAANSYGPEGDIAFRGESAILQQRTILAAAPRIGDDLIAAPLR